MSAAITVALAVSGVGFVWPILGMFLVLGRSGHGAGTAAGVWILFFLAPGSVAFLGGLLTALLFWSLP